MATRQIAHPTIFTDANRTEGLMRTSAQIVEAYHRSAERVVDFTEGRQSKLDHAKSPMGRVAARASLIVPRLKTVEGLRSATQVSIYHLYNQRLGTFYGGLLERLLPEYMETVPPLKDISELTEEERSGHLDSLRAYDEQFPSDEPIFDVEVEALRLARVDRIGNTIAEGAMPATPKLGRRLGFRPEPILYDLVYGFYQDEAPRHDIKPVEFDPQAFRS